MKKRLIFAQGALTLSVFALAAPAQAQRGPMPSLMSINPQGPVVNLTVSDGISVAPDIAYVSFGVTSRDRNKVLAMQQNRKASEAVLAALRSAGIAEKDIKTGWFNVSEDFDYSQGGQSRKLGYLVSNSFLITIRKLDSLSDVVAGATAAGASEVASPAFDVEVKTPIIEKLTRSATEKARQRAQFHSQLNGYTGIRLVSVSDEVISTQRDSGVFGFAEAMAAPSLRKAPLDIAAPDMRPQQVSINVSLYMTFEMTK